MCYFRPRDNAGKWTEPERLLERRAVSAQGVDSFFFQPPSSQALDDAALRAAVAQAEVELAAAHRRHKGLSSGTLAAVGAALAVSLVAVLGHARMFGTPEAEDADAPDTPAPTEASGKPLSASAADAGELRSVSAAEGSKELADASHAADGGRMPSLKLHKLVQKGDAASVAAFLASDSDAVDRGDPELGGATALLLALRLGRDEIARLLMQSGASVNKPGPWGLTPAMCKSTASLLCVFFRAEIKKKVLYRRGGVQPRVGVGGDAGARGWRGHRLGGGGRARQHGAGPRAWRGAQDARGYASAARSRAQVTICVQSFDEVADELIALLRSAIRRLVVNARASSSSSSACI